MTLLRKLPIAISNRVTRWSSPGCKDWAFGCAMSGLLFSPARRTNLRRIERLDALLAEHGEGNRASLGS